MPRLELCSRVILSKVLSHMADTIRNTIYAVVLGWLPGNPKRFKPFVGNKVAEISEPIPVGCWRHYLDTENPEDCASRGMFLSQLAQYELWWHAYHWLNKSVEGWPSETEFPEHPIPSGEKELQQNVSAVQPVDLPLFKEISN